MSEGYTPTEASAASGKTRRADQAKLGTPNEGGEKKKSASAPLVPDRPTDTRSQSTNTDNSTDPDQTMLNPAPPPSTNNNNPTDSAGQTMADHPSPPTAEFNIAAIESEVTDFDAQQKKKDTDNPKKCMQYTPLKLNNNHTIQHTETQLSVLKKQYEEDRFSEASNQLLTIIGQYPSKLLLKSKCQVVILILKSNTPTKEELGKAYHLLLRCKFRLSLVSDSSSEETENEDKQLLNTLLVEVCNQLKSMGINVEGGDSMGDSERMNDDSNNNNTVIDSMIRRSAELEEQKDRLAAYNVQLMLNISMDCNITAAMTQRTINLYKETLDMSLLYDALVYIEKVLSTWSDTLPDSLEMEGESSMIEQCMHCKLQILNQLINADGISLLTILSSYGSLILAGQYIKQYYPYSDKKSECEEVMDSANKLLDKLAIPAKGSGAEKALRQCLINENIIKALLLLWEAVKGIKRDDEAEDNAAFIIHDWMDLIEEATTSNDSNSKKNKWFKPRFDNIYDRANNLIGSTKNSEDITGKDIDGSVFTVLKAGDTFTANMSDGLCQESLLAQMFHWASPSCLNYIDVRGDGEYDSKVARTNPCIDAYNGYAARIFCSENGLPVSDDILGSVDLGTTCLDQHVIVANHKPSFPKEHASHIHDTPIANRETHMTANERNGLQALNLVSQAIYANMNGIKLRVGVPSMPAWQAMFASCGPTITLLIIFLGYLPHGQNIVAPQKQMSVASFSSPDLDEFNEKMIALYTVFTILRPSCVSQIMHIMAGRVDQPMEIKLLLLEQQLQGCINGGLEAQRLRRMGNDKLGPADYNKIKDLNWKKEFEGLENSKAAMIKKFHQVVLRELGKVIYSKLIEKQWNLIYSSIAGGAATSQLYDDALMLLANGDVDNLTKNHLSLLLKKTVDEGDVGTLRELALAIREGNELTEEQSAFLDGYDMKWSAWFDILQDYKTEVYDKHSELKGKIFHVLNQDNTTFKRLSIDKDKFGGLNGWLMSQLKLFKEKNWRSDEVINDKLGLPPQTRVSSIRKCVLNQRRLKLKEWSLEELGEEFNPDAMEVVAREKPGRVNKFRARRRKIAN